MCGCARRVEHAELSRDERPHARRITAPGTNRRQTGRRRPRRGARKSRHSGSPTYMTSAGRTAVGSGAISSGGRQGRAPRDARGTHCSTRLRGCGGSCGAVMRASRDRSAVIVDAPALRPGLVHRAATRPGQACWHDVSRETSRDDAARAGLGCAGRMARARVTPTGRPVRARRPRSLTACAVGCRRQMGPSSR